MSAPENPQAFPFVDGPVVEPGMTLRDWLAGQALAGMSLRPNFNFATGEAGSDDMRRDAEGVARAAYRYADALLATRQEKAQ